jgi:tRNA U34 2-thiouridine synthase MnmA/TrmU
VVLYTIGERHGFKIYPEFQTTENKEMYVIKKDLDKNILYVSVKMPEKLRSNFSGQNNNLKLEKLSFINETFKTNDILQIRIRYRGEKINVRVVDFNEKEKTCQLEILEKNVENKNLNTAAGQFGVFYIGEKVLGGGVFV